MPIGLPCQPKITPLGLRPEWAAVRSAWMAHSLDSRLRDWLRMQVRGQQEDLGKALERAGVVKSGQAWVSKYVRRTTGAATLDHIGVIAAFFERSIVELITEVLGDRATWSMCRAGLDGPGKVALLKRLPSLNDDQVQRVLVPLADSWIQMGLEHEASTTGSPPGSAPARTRASGTKSTRAARR